MLSNVERATLCAVADLLIPVSGDMPSFSRSGAQNVETDRVLTLRPELLDDLRAALAAAATLGDTPDLADRLNRDRPAALGVIGLVASSAYYLVPDIREKLGYPGQLQKPATEDEEHDYADLLRPVIDRGPIYRPVKPVD